MKKAPLITVFLVLGILATLHGCGKKGPPTLPRKAFDMQVTNLSGEWSEGYFRLSGDLVPPGRSAGETERIRGCRVYYGEYPPDNPPCEGCPVKYQGYHGFGKDVVREEGFFCEVPGKTRDRIYFFCVYLIGPEGSLGPPSERLRVSLK